MLREVITRSTRDAQPVRLQFLRINPVRTLYERFGFRITGETVTHYLAERFIDEPAA